MKKVFFLFAISVFAPLAAMYQSNPAAPELVDEGLFICPDFFLGVKAGYQFDNVFNRRLVLSNLSGQVDDSEILANQGVVTLNIFDRVEIWGSGGAANFHFSNEINVPPTTHPQKIDYKTHNGWIWGVGGRAALFSWGCLTLGGSASYQQSAPELHWNTDDGMPFPHTAHFHYSEWQVGMGLAYQVEMFVPYIGGTFSRAKAKLSRLPSGTLIGFPSSRTIKMHSQQHWGLTVGCDISPGRIVDFGVEFRMFSELAVTLKGNLKF